MNRPLAVGIPSESNNATIKLKLRSINQLFNSMDPSPFVEKDLDADAEEFIVSWAQEFPRRAPLTLRVYLEQRPAEEPTAVVREAVHNYFAYRRNLNELEFRRLMKLGRISLLIGLLFLGACLATTTTLLASAQGKWADVLRESVTIGGWVAMWRPMEIYLYEWWPLRQMGRTYSKLSRMPVEVSCDAGG
ncbi:MAG TPA: hypothetical protein VMT17_12210 [Anaeromyxobacteraceae bacterium]|nr:hypothetical protein [Anaeromyxobacteraceae bacterium]